jgi:hypothetical protein
MKKIDTTELLTIFITIIVEVLLFGWFVMLLWNYNIPVIFPGANSLSYGQAIGVYGICRLLFSRNS